MAFLAEMMTIYDSCGYTSFKSTADQQYVDHPGPRHATAVEAAGQ